MPLRMTPSGSRLLAALVPPGNIAAVLSEYRAALFRLLGSPAAFPFPCAAPLAWISSPAPQGGMEALAVSAPRAYDHLEFSAGFLLLAPPPEAGCSASAFDGPAAAPARGDPEFSPPCGGGFPLAYFPDGASGPRDLSALPPAPRLAFRTFQVMALSVRWAKPRSSCLVWEAVGSIRYPVRILSAP